MKCNGHRREVSSQSVLMQNCSSGRVRGRRFWAGFERDRRLVIGTTGELDAIKGCSINVIFGIVPWLALKSCLLCIGPGDGVGGSGCGWLVVFASSNPQKEPEIGSHSSWF
jgi:hypothetical protein